MDRTIYRNFAQLLPLLALMWTPAQAGNLTIPHTFQTGTPVAPAEANANFSAVESAVDDNDARIAQLETRIAIMEDYIDQLQTVMQLQTDAQGHPAVVFTGVNLHVNNGLGSTGSLNGRGNLIVGYDEPRTTTNILSCSDGRFDNQADCEVNNALWALSYKTGSHNLIVGPGHNYSSNGGFVAGFENIINFFNASVLGGANNRASGASSTISGGANNVTTTSFSSISGGDNNRASGLFSAVGGGVDNTASGHASSICGGWSNTASGQVSSVSGGRDNTASNDQSSISGGFRNTASGDYSSVSGGSNNTASGPASNVSGGGSNRANGGTSSVSGGWSNTAGGSGSSISGGRTNTAVGQNSSVSGGLNRNAPGSMDWVAGGFFQDQ